jgi:hypothetical protein
MALSKSAEFGVGYLDDAAKIRIPATHRKPRGASPDGHSIARRGAGAGNDEGEKAYFAVCETDFPVAHIPEYAGLEG